MLPEKRKRLKALRNRNLKIVPHETTRIGASGVHGVVNTTHNKYACSFFDSSNKRVIHIGTCDTIRAAELLRLRYIKINLADKMTDSMKARLAEIETPDTELRDLEEQILIHERKVRQLKQKRKTHLMGDSSPRPLPKVS